MNALKMMVKIGAAVAAVALMSTTASAADLIVTTAITPYTKDGEPVVLRETGADGCIYTGVFHDTAHTASSLTEKLIAAGRVAVTDWSIELIQKQCGRIASPTKGLIGLRQTHSYMDANGRLQPGYAPGDSVATFKEGQK